MRSRKEALTSNRPLYFTGKACPRGHIDYRRTQNGECCQCARDRAVAKYYSFSEESKQKTYAWRARNREKYRQYLLSRRERQTLLVKRWRLNNLEKCRAREAKYRANNRELRKAQHKRWRKANVDKARLQVRNRQARRKGGKGKYTLDDIKRLFSAQKGMCAYCRTDLTTRRHVDHIIPLSRGGTNYPANLQLLCPQCNGRKHARDPMDFARKEFGLLL